VQYADLYTKFIISNYKKMKKSVNCEFFGGGKGLYHTPEIEMYAMPVEGGFLVSPDPDGDGLEDINGDGVVDEADKWF